MTMTTGEFEFDTLFQQGGDNTEDVPYLPVSVILWIIFIILMPILLTNLLVRLPGNGENAYIRRCMYIQWLYDIHTEMMIN